MVQGGEHLRLALEPGEPVLIEREGLGEDLQRDVATELGVARPIHIAHAAGVDFGGNLVRAEARAGRDRHVKLN